MRRIFKIEFYFGLCLWCVLFSPALALATTDMPFVIKINRRWDVEELRDSSVDIRQQIRKAGELLGEWQIDLAGSIFTGETLIKLSQTPKSESMLRAAREILRRPVKLHGFIWFLDDLIRAGRRGLHSAAVSITPDRARRVGIFMHPKEVFNGLKHRYPARQRYLNLEPIPDVVHIEPAKNWSTLGPEWAMRYLNPEGEPPMLTALAEQNPSGTFHLRLNKLFSQLRAQGTEVLLDSTLRSPARGYLMWGAYILSRARSAKELKYLLKVLDQRNKDWRLRIPIRWSIPKGWQETRAAAQAMAETYSVVFATESGAKNSNHYTALAADFSAVNLPRQLTLESPDGAIQQTFDLSEAGHPRDLSLSPKIIAWIEKHFHLEKLPYDYPHWNDIAKAQPLN